MRPSCHSKLGQEQCQNIVAHLWGISVAPWVGEQDGDTGDAIFKYELDTPAHVVKSLRETFKSKADIPDSWIEHDIKRIPATLRAIIAAKGCRVDSVDSTRGRRSEPRVAHGVSEGHTPASLQPAQAEKLSGWLSKLDKFLIQPARDDCPAFADKYPPVSS